MAIKKYSDLETAFKKWRGAVQDAQDDLRLSSQFIVAKLGQRLFESARSASPISRKNRTLRRGVQHVFPARKRAYSRMVWELERWRAGAMVPRIYMSRAAAERRKKIGRRGLGKKSWGWLIQKIPGISAPASGDDGYAPGEKNTTAKVAVTFTGRAAELFASSRFGYLLRRVPNLIEQSRIKAMNKMRHTDLVGIGRAYRKKLAGGL